MSFIAVFFIVFFFVAIVLGPILARRAARLPDPQSRRAERRPPWHE